jgi:hypothetical protein
MFLYINGARPVGAQGDHDGVDAGAWREGGMIPPSVLESLSGIMVSQQLREAAADLGFRLAHGEYDDLDDMQRADLQSLSQMLEYWSGRVAELEAGVRVPGPVSRAQQAKS